MLKAVDNYLLPIQSSCWKERDVQLSERGIKLKWFIHFLYECAREISEMWRLHRRDKEASFWRDFPEPPEPIYSDRYFKTREFVKTFILPLTHQIKAPLYARIPPEQRGSPSVFISHTWDSYLISEAHGSLEMVYDYGLKGDHDACVWLDVVCYNQHIIGHPALDMNVVVSAMDSIAFAVTHSSPFFQRSWCLWELICAQRSGIYTNFCDQSLRIQRKYFSSEAHLYPPEFTSVSDAVATKKSDQADIMNAIIAAFGTISAADDFIRAAISRD